MPRQKNAAATLAEKMLRVLESEARPAAEAPQTLRQLAAVAEPSAPPELILKAAARKDFTDRVLVAHKKSLDAPVALATEAESFAGSPALLAFVLEAVCTPAAPTWSVARLAAKVPAPLKKPFQEALVRRVNANDLPPGVGCLRDKKASALYLLRMPPPPPPGVALAEKLVRVLEAQRRLGAGSYPLTLDRLVELTDAQAPPALRKKALAEEAFQAKVIRAVARKPDAPVALAEDREALAASPLLLEYVLENSRKADTHAFPPSALMKKVAAPLQSIFQIAIKRQIEEASLPPTVGWVGIRKQPHLFLMRDLHAHPRDIRPTPPRGSRATSPPTVSPGEFAGRFDEAFARLDRAKGSHNFIHLLDLRQALGVSRAAFDAGLDQLRRAGRYVLSAAEGRHGLTAEERSAGIAEDGALLLYVSRRHAP